MALEKGEGNKITGPCKGASVRLFKLAEAQNYLSVCHCGNAILSIFYTSTLMLSPSTTTL